MSAPTCIAVFVSLGQRCGAPAELVVGQWCSKCGHKRHEAYYCEASFTRMTRNCVHCGALGSVNLTEPVRLKAAS